MPSEQGIRKYREFHGRSPESYNVKNIKNFNTLIPVGNPEFIAYESDKFNGGGNGKKQFFKHKFSASTKMYCNPDGNMLIIIGRKLKVNSRGIVG